MDFLYSIDIAIFYLFNHTFSTGFLDKFFSLITDVGNWYIAYLILAGIAFFKGGAKGKIAVIGLILLITFTDQTNHKILKEIFERLRPCNAFANVLTPVGCRGSFSFPSNHAVNNFAAAAFLTPLFPKFKWIFIVTASLLAISRVYLGLHYPSDILGGAIIGSFIGYLFSVAALKIDTRFTEKNKCI
jgi:undecaprenyl-diphosphatase